MPEPSFLSLYSYTPEPPKKSPIIKLSCGIGDTDGFPAFDVDSDQYASKDDSKWGFLITGGAEFHMPLTVFQVTPDGLADKGGICLGDIILQINEEDATNLTLQQAHDKIDSSGKKIQFLVKSMDDEEPMEGYEPGEERSIVLRVPKPPPPPKDSTIEKRLQELQDKLMEIAEIPKILSSTLATVSQTFDKLTTTLPLPMPSSCRHDFQSECACCPHLNEHDFRRKLSYDEDIYDYELSDEADEGDGTKEEFNVKQAYLQLKRYAAKQRISKEATPESDYASESNYQPNEKDSKNQYNMTFLNKGDNSDFDNNDNATAANVSDEENDNSKKSCDMYEEFHLSMLNKPFDYVDIESGIEEHDDDNNKVGNDEEDFLTTTFTWNLRNKHIRTNDSDEISNNSNKTDNEDDDKFNFVQRKSLNESNKMLCQKRQIKADTPEREQKMDKLERSWPWADREKIIYK